MLLYHFSCLVSEWEQVLQMAQFSITCMYASDNAFWPYVMGPARPGGLSAHYVKPAY